MQKIIMIDVIEQFHEGNKCVGRASSYTICYFT